MSTYEEFLKTKALESQSYGIAKPGRISKQLFPFQRDIVKWALKRGRAAIFADCGLGKTAMQRTKAIGLLNKQLCKDSSLSRQGIADYLVTMRKEGVNEEPIGNDKADGIKFHEYIGEQGPKPGDARRFSIDVWQRYASPVWFDIDASNTLQKESAREDKDERHICPLQLDVIRRAIALWTNPGDVVLSPFLGIGSEGYVALQEGRKFVGIELKKSYFDQAIKNLASVEPGGKNQQISLFGGE